MKIITISRQFGSGGREIAKRLSDELGIAYYDKEILEQLSEKLEMDKDYIERMLNKGIAANYPYMFRHTFYYTTPVIDQVSTVWEEQHDIIRRIAQKGESCIIVGRGASGILEKYNPFNIFVHADEQSKLIRCKERAEPSENLTDKEIIRKMRQIDRSRASFHNISAAYPWGDRRGYHLCINTSGVNIKEIVPAIAQYIRVFLDK